MIDRKSEVPNAFFRGLAKISISTNRASSHCSDRIRDHFNTWRLNREMSSSEAGLYIVLVIVAVLITSVLFGIIALAIFQHDPIISTNFYDAWTDSSGSEYSLKYCPSIPKSFVVGFIIDLILLIVFKNLRKVVNWFGDQYDRAYHYVKNHQ